jgi:hypothetical protein
VRNEISIFNIISNVDVLLLESIVFGILSVTSFLLIFVCKGVFGVNLYMQMEWLEKLIKKLVSFDFAGLMDLFSIKFLDEAIVFLSVCGMFTCGLLVILKILINPKLQELHRHVLKARELQNNSNAIDNPLKDDPNKAENNKNELTELMNRSIEAARLIQKRIIRIVNFLNALREMGIVLMVISICIALQAISVDLSLAFFSVFIASFLLSKFEYKRVGYSKRIKI